MPVACDAAVAVSALVKRYRHRVAVDGLSLVAQRGAVTAVLGPNGAGKTTAVECCEGLRRADAGHLRVLGLDPYRHRRQLRPRVGVMLQDGGLPAAARCGEVLRHVAAMHARPLPPGELLELLGLAAVHRSPVRRLSGGERQRLALAAALVGRPEVAFLDEPTAGLDPQARQLVWTLVQRLRDDGVAIVLTTHLLDEAERLADHVVVMGDGRTVAAGSPAELTGGNAAESLRFSAVPGLDLRELTAALPVGVRVSEPRAGRYVAEGGPNAPVDPQVIATVTAWCAAQGVMPQELMLDRRSLEDVFLELTGGSAA